MTYDYYTHRGPNLSKPLVSLMFPSVLIFVSTPTLNHCYKPRYPASTVGFTRFVYMRSTTFRSTSKFLPSSRLVFGSLLFIVDKMGDLSLQKTKSREEVGSNTDRFPPMPVRVNLACEARLGHGSSNTGESELDPSGDRVDHHEVSCPEVAYLIYKLS
jgi:hypothetical protein